VTLPTVCGSTHRESCIDIVMANIVGTITAQESDQFPSLPGRLKRTSTRQMAALELIILSLLASR
jgi:hypothetical protein